VTSWWFALILKSATFALVIIKRKGKKREFPKKEQRHYRPQLPPKLWDKIQPDVL